MNQTQARNDRRLRPMIVWGTIAINAALIWMAKLALSQRSALISKDALADQSRAEQLHQMFGGHGSWILSPVTAVALAALSISAVVISNELDKRKRHSANDANNANDESPLVTRSTLALVSTALGIASLAGYALVMLKA